MPRTLAHPGSLVYPLTSGSLGKSEVSQPTSVLPELMPYSPAATAKRTLNSRCEITLRLEIPSPPFERRRRRNPKKRIIARTILKMAAVYENLSSDLVWQVVRTLPTKENIPPWEEFVLGDIVKRRNDGGKCRATGMRRQNRKT
jgi:hypothetical protein